jgi:molybdenum cofactor cytidylyltransferase
MGNLAIIILAAGPSSRFQGVKQLAAYRETSFIRHAITEALKTQEKVIVVLGANAEKVKREIEDLPVAVVLNTDWEEGMSSSIRSGLTALLEGEPSAQGAVFMVCDQPFVSSRLLTELFTKYKETAQPIIASAYEHTIGTPVLFANSFFPALLALSGKSGAKKIIQQNKDLALTIPFPLGHVDIDTQEDYLALQGKHFKN